MIIMSPLCKQYKFSLLLFLYFTIPNFISITTKLLVIVLGIMRGNAQENYKKIVNSIFKENFRFRNNFSQLPTKPTIFVATYPHSPIEYLIPALLPLPICFVASRRAMKIMSKVYPESECAYLPDGKDRYHMTKKLIKEKLKVMSVFIYSEDQSRRYGRSVGKIRKGAFWIAKELGATITPIVLDRVVEQLGKQNYQIYIGPTMQVSNPLETLIKVRTVMREKKSLFIKRKFIL